jgi:DNA-binding MarR family transcriptional regulator
MTDPESPWYADVVLPMLLGASRKTYGRAMRRALTDAGFEDMPRAGSRLVGGIGRNGPSLGDLADNLGISKQATSQLVETLVERGYVQRVPHPTDGRRTIVDLTDRGRQAADVIRGAVEGVDARLAASASPEDIATMRRVLGALVESDDPHFA